MSNPLKRDYLKFETNDVARKMLSKKSNAKDEVYFSQFVEKVNRKNKKQTRVMVVTDVAVYNVMPNDWSKCKRRIELDKVQGCTVSATSDEFIVHVPSECDYRYLSEQREEIAELICILAKKRTKKDISVKHLDDGSLKDLQPAKHSLRMQAREAEMTTRFVPLNMDDKKEADEEKNAEVTTLFQQLSKDKVTLQDFDLLTVIGKGAFGKVIQCRLKKTGQIFAMKIMKKAQIIARGQAEHIVAERFIMEQLQHPFLMGLRYAFQTQHKLYFVLDYYNGGELFYHLKKKRRFTEDEARIYIAEVGSALGHLHSMGIIYRDLKPENILLDDRGHVCLIDFGLSKEFDSKGMDKTQTFCGTPEYLAPEIVVGCGHDKEVDWWSLGILLYELAVGIPPFYSQNTNEMYHRIQHGVLRFPPFLSEHCKSLIVALLHRNPNKRLGSSDADWAAIKAHPFFKPLDWDALFRKETEAPYKPHVKGHMDTSNFDKEFTELPAKDSVLFSNKSQKAQPMQKPQDPFSGFTYVSPVDLAAAEKGEMPATHLPESQIRIKTKKTKEEIKAEEEERRRAEEQAKMHEAKAKPKGYRESAPAGGIFGAKKGVKPRTPQGLSVKPGKKPGTAPPMIQQPSPGTTGNRGVRVTSPTPSNNSTFPRQKRPSSPQGKKPNKGFAALRGKFE